MDKKQENKMKKEYRQQRNNTKGRLDANKEPILFQMTFEEWKEIWLDSGHYSNRGRKKGQYCMMRKDDIGHYEVDNVTIGLRTKNSSDVKYTEAQNKANSERNKGAKNHNADLTIYHFINKSGDTFTGTRYELMDAFQDCKLSPTGISGIVLGKRKTHRGWRIDKNK